MHLITGILGRAAEEGRNRRIRMAEREAAQRDAAASAAAAEQQAMDDARKDDPDYESRQWEFEGENVDRDRSRRGGERGGERR